MSVCVTEKVAAEKRVRTMADKISAPTVYVHRGRDLERHLFEMKDVLYSAAEGWNPTSYHCFTLRAPPADARWLTTAQVLHKVGVIEKNVLAH